MTPEQVIAALRAALAEAADALEWVFQIYPTAKIGSAAEHARRILAAAPAQPQDDDEYSECSDKEWEKRM